MVTKNNFEHCYSIDEQDDTTYRYIISIPKIPNIQGIRYNTSYEETKNYIHNVLSKMIARDPWIGNQIKGAKSRDKHVIEDVCVICHKTFKLTRQQIWHLNRHHAYASSINERFGRKSNYQLCCSEACTRKHIESLKNNY